LTASQEVIGPVEGNAFNNSGLFSNHYLENTVQKVPEWSGDDAHLFEVYSQIKVIFDRKKNNFENYVEAELEHHWIRPVLEILGHHFGAQESLHHDPLKPDYAFFPDKQTLEEAYSHKKDGEDFYKKAVAVGDAKAWNVLLDKSRQGRANREMTNPSFQIDVYLRATPPKWAILTNGKLWRLYHEDTSVKMDCYYEVDLPDLINKIDETGDIKPFKYFYLFFRVEAFPQMPLGPSFLDRIREESAAYAQKIGTDLQENVYRAMKVLSEGFFAESSNSLSYSTKDVKEVQENSLRLLYRLLFIFYAESRKLLNTDNKHYLEMSLRKLKEEVSEKIDQGESILAVRTTYWEGLKDLFRLINDGSEAFGYPKEEFYIPAYNGGLFDPSENPFLSQKRMGNSYLAEAIDLLARSKGESGMVFVDYSSLNIRHLGSIYEGILEYKLRLAEEPMVAIKEKGKEIWLPKREAGSKKISDSVEAGRLYLVTDKGERKATGSYYTPEYIVKYIVKNTLAPLIDPMMEEAIWSEELRKELLKKLLSIKVLDPAMGSGHFLVEATDYIAREIIHAKEIARREDIDTEDVAEHDVHWARREVVRNCIYGVDLNPMAVDLAKLSLWLTTMAANKPLSFLNHHLRCRNSLVGVDLESLINFPGVEKEKGTQSDDVTATNRNIKPKDRARIKRVSKDEKQVSLRTFFEILVKQNADTLIMQYKAIASKPDDDLQTIKDKEAEFKKIQMSEPNCRLKELANVWLSSYFGNQVSEEDYYDLRDHLSVEMIPDWSRFRSEGWFKQAQDIASERRFFNWELEFPEAFFEGKAGFDAVIGNPPYIRDRLQEYASDDYFFKSKFKSAFQKYDIYALFVEAGIKYLSKNANLGFIIPNKFMAARYGIPLRKLVLSKTKIKNIVDVSDISVFKDVSVYPVILIVEKSPENVNNKIQFDFIDKMDGVNMIPSITHIIGQKTFFETPDNMFISTLTDDNVKILDKISNISTCLGDLFNINEGVHTGNLRRELIHSEKLDEHTRPVYFGENFERYASTWSNLFIQYDWNIIKNYSGGYGSLRDEAIFTASEKIICREIHTRLSCTYDTKKKYFLNHLYSITRKTIFPEHLLYVTAIFNSKMLSFIFDVMFINAHISGGYRQYKAFYLKQLPIRRISFSTPEDGRRHLAEELKGLCAAGKFEKVLKVVGDCLPKNDAGEFIAEGERSDVVHDLLAHLAEEMIRMNKEKRDEIKKFLGWLENDMGARVDELTNKTKIQAYFEIEFPEFLAVLNKNKKKIQVDYSRYDPNSRLLEAFNTSLSRLKPLIAKIEETDHLIDQVVYKLYGLTDEEIKIIEDAISK